jgi:acyl-CoA thioester hydrolase
MPLKHHSSPVTHHSSPVFSWPVRVYYEDTDHSGAVYYANYLKFLERARTEWLRALGFELTDLATRYQIAFVVRSLSIEYAKPAAFNDELAVTVEPDAVKGGQIVLAQRVLRDGAELATARVRLACINTASFKPARIPSSLADSLVGHAAKE